MLNIWLLSFNHLIFYFSSWKSLIHVRKRHFQAGQSACAKGLGSVTQKDLALTQFGFMGFILIRPKHLGIQCDNKEDREAFVHVWRTVGYMMGLEDRSVFVYLPYLNMLSLKLMYFRRFNICRQSLEETEDLCEALLTKIFGPLLSTPNQDFENMAKALLEGMWTFNPFIHYNTFMYFTRRLCGVPEYKFPLHHIVDKNDNNNLKDDNNKISKKILKSMHWYPRSLLFFMIYVLEVTMRFKIFRTYFNSQIRLSLFLIKNFPFLAFFKFRAYQKCFVDIRVDIPKSNIMVR